MVGGTSKSCKTCTTVAALSGCKLKQMLMRAATVVQQVCKSCRTCFKFYCMFYFTCDRSFNPAYKAGSLRTPRLHGTKPTYRPLPRKCETHITSVYRSLDPARSLLLLLQLPCRQRRGSVNEDLTVVPPPAVGFPPEIFSPLRLRATTTRRYPCYVTSFRPV